MQFDAYGFPLDRLSQNDAEVIMQAARAARRHRTRTLDGTAYAVIADNAEASALADASLAIEYANRTRWPILAYGLAVVAGHRGAHWVEPRVVDLADGDHFAGMPR